MRAGMTTLEARHGTELQNADMALADRWVQGGSHRWVALPPLPFRGLSHRRSVAPVLPMGGQGILHADHVHAPHGAMEICDD